MCACWSPSRAPASARWSKRSPAAAPPAPSPTSPTSSSAPAGWTLLILNIVLFVFGATAAFLRHDPHPDYEAAWRAQDRARRRLTKLRTRYETAVHARQRGFDEQLAALDQLLRETQAKHDELGRGEQAIGPFFAETGMRIANTVRNRALAFLEGAIGAIPAGPMQGSLAEVQALSETEVFRRITEDLVRQAVIGCAARCWRGWCCCCPGMARAAEDYCSYGKATAVLLVDRTTAFDDTDKTLFLQALDGVVAGTRTRRPPGRLHHDRRLHGEPQDLRPLQAGLPGRGLLRRAAGDLPRRCWRGRTRSPSPASWRSHAGRAAAQAGGDAVLRPVPHHRRGRARLRERRTGSAHADRVLGPDGELAAAAGARPAPPDRRRRSCSGSRPTACKSARRTPLSA